MGKFMTKREALAEFIAFMKEAGIPRSDEVWWRTEWNDYTDALCKCGEISTRQYETWDNPF